jgi:hypothetical protein
LIDTADFLNDSSLEPRPPLGRLLKAQRLTEINTRSDRVPLRGVAQALAVPSGQSRELISLRLAG